MKTLSWSVQVTKCESTKSQGRAVASTWLNRRLPKAPVLGSAKIVKYLTIKLTLTVKDEKVTAF